MTPEEAYYFQQGWDRYKEGPGDVPTVVEEAERAIDGAEAEAACPLHGVVLRYDESRRWREWFCPVDNCGYETFDHGRLVE